MIMNIFRIFSVIAIVAFVFPSCKKDSNTDPQPTKTEMLAGGHWTLTALTLSPAIIIGGVSYTDGLAVYPECSKDDFQEFFSDGTYNYDEGATKCDANGPQTETGTWKFNSDETELTINGPSYTDVWKITSLTSTTMTSVYHFTQDGVDYTATGKLVKK